MDENAPAADSGVHRRALAYLGELEEDTMRRAWGERSADDRRRIVLAAILFGRQLEERLTEGLPSGELERQRFLMSLMNAVIAEFAGLESVGRDEATAFLSDVGNRDHVLEFDEVLEAYGTDDSGRTLDGLLQEAVNGRVEKARWADHWSSG